MLSILHKLHAKNLFCRELLSKKMMKEQEEVQEEHHSVIERKTTTDVFIDEDSSAHGEAMAMTYQLYSAT